MNKQIHIEAGQVVREAARVQPSQLPLKSLALAVAVAFQPAWAQVVPATPVQVPVKLPATPVAKNALPTGGQVVAGSATIKQQGQELTVQQTTQKLITNWQSFNIGAGETTRFIQPSASSAVRSFCAAAFSTAESAPSSDCVATPESFTELSC